MPKCMSWRNFALLFSYIYSDTMFAKASAFFFSKYSSPSPTILSLLSKATVYNRVVLTTCLWKYKSWSQFPSGPPNRIWNPVSRGKMKDGFNCISNVSEELKLFYKPQLGLIPPPWGKKEVLCTFMETQTEKPTERLINLHQMSYSQAAVSQEQNGISS